ncbi:MAG TPA: CBS domain-containing protein, partial [Gammaproteobacteria bacterium]|nr:CBS domain-containing protein [Gammaproteobacteria bacterium]
VEVILEYFTPAYSASLLAALEPAVAGRLFSRLLPDFQVVLLRQLERGSRESLLDELPSDLATAMRRLLPYPDGTCGAIMEAPLASVPEALSVRYALKRIKRIRRGMKFYVYVANTQGQLVGVLTLHELLNAPAAVPVGEVMHRHVTRLSPAEPVQAVLNSPYWQEFHALPVTDRNNVLLGVIRQKSLRRFQEQSVQADTVSGSLENFIAVGGLFAVTAGQLLTLLITTGGALRRGDPRD